MNIAVGVYGFGFTRDHFKMANRDVDETKIEVTTIVENLGSSQVLQRTDSELPDQILSQSYENNSPQQSQAMPEVEDTGSDEEPCQRRAVATPGFLLKIHRLIKEEAITLEELKNYVSMRQFIIAKTLEKN